MHDDELLVEILKCRNDTKIGHITLNSPETLNSLTLNMVNEISKLLDKWEADPQIKMVSYWTVQGIRPFVLEVTSEHYMNRCVLPTVQFLQKRFLSLNID